MLKSIKFKKQLLFLLFIFFITIYMWEVDGKFGFNPSDEARVLGMVQRLHNGQVPHKDFMYQTFVGSAYLHYFQYFIPNYNLQIQRIIAIIMFQIYSLLLLSLSSNFKKSNLPVKLSAFVVSVILNMHYFEFFIWPTIDGIFVISIGAFLIFNSKKYKNIGFLFIGLAPLMKTGFLISSVGVILIENFFIKKFSIKYFFRTSLISAIPSFTYLTYITVSGGFKNLYEETFNQPDNSLELINSWIHHLGFYEKQLIPISFLIVLYFFSNSKKNIFFFTNPIIKILVFFLIIFSMNFNNLNYKPIINLLNLFFVFFLLLKFKRKNSKTELIPFFVCYVIEVGAIMSIGWRWGLFVSGTVLVLILYFILEQMNFENWKINYSIYLLSFTIFINPMINLMSLRSNNTFLDRPKSELIYNLIELDKRFGNIYTSENVYEYIKSIQYCIDKYETSKISIFPDNPVLYFILNLDNPIPLDWHTMGVEGKVDYDDIRIKRKMLENEYKNSVIFLQSYKVSRLKNLSLDEVLTVNQFPYPELLQDEYRVIYNYLKSRNNTEIEYCKSFTVLINN